MQNEYVNYRASEAYRKMMLRLEYAMYYPEEISCGKFHHMFSSGKCEDCEQKIQLLDERLSDIALKNK